MLACCLDWSVDRSVRTYVSSASTEQLVAAAQPIMGGTAPTTAPTHVLTSLRVLESV